MSRYTIELVQHEEKDTTYLLTVEAADATEARDTLEQYLAAYTVTPELLPGRCPGVLACAEHEEQETGPYMDIISVQACPEERDPNQLVFL